MAGSPDIGLEEIEQAAGLVQAAVHPDANVIFGATFDETLDDEIRVTVIATGFEKAPGQLPNKMVEETEKQAEEEAPAGPEPLGEEDVPKPDVPEDDPFEAIFQIFNKKD